MFPKYNIHGIQNDSIKGTEVNFEYWPMRRDKGIKTHIFGSFKRPPFNMNFATSVPCTSWVEISKSPLIQCHEWAITKIWPILNHCQYVWEVPYVLGATNPSNTGIECMISLSLNACYKCSSVNSSCHSFCLNARRKRFCWLHRFCLVLGWTIK